LNAENAQNSERENRILSAADDLITRYGYDKTTVSDIARVAGVSKGAIYLHFESKETLFEALLRRELQHYMQIWLDCLDSQPESGTIGTLYRASLVALKRSPLLSALLRRDQQVLGTLLRKPGTLFASMQAGTMRVDTIRALQAVGAIRPNFDPAVIARIMDLFSYGLISIDQYKSADTAPPLDAVVETLGAMLDHYLTPDEPDAAAGNAVIHQMMEAVRQQIGRSPSSPSHTETP
jgi:TetR/AcrR family acrAB operon transcriptional repressor